MEMEIKSSVGIWPGICGIIACVVSYKPIFDGFINHANTNGDYILESYDGDEWLPSIQFARVINKGGQVIITPLNIDNEKCYVPERLTEEQYLKKYKNKYSIIRLIRDYTK